MVVVKVLDLSAPILGLQIPDVELDQLLFILRVDKQEFQLPEDDHDLVLGVELESGPEIEPPLEIVGVILSQRVVVMELEIVWHTGPSQIVPLELEGVFLNRPYERVVRDSEPVHGVVVQI